MKRLSSLLGVFSVAMTIAAAWLIFGFAPTEAVMGPVQKIFYIHVPSAYSMYLNWIICAVASVLWIVRRHEKWDILAACAAETAMLFAAAVMITGPLWGKSVWSSYWTWDPRLTSALILTCIIAAYVLLRASNTPHSARFAAVLAIAGAVTIPAIHFSIQIWRGQHPVVLGRGGGGISSDMTLVLIGCMVAFTVISAAFLAFGYQNKSRHRRITSFEEAFKHAESVEDRAQLLEDINSAFKGEQ